MGQGSLPIHSLACQQKAVFLVNSRSSRFYATFSGIPYSKAYGINLPSSLRIILLSPQYTLLAHQSQIQYSKLSILFLGYYYRPNRKPHRCHLSVKSQRLNQPTIFFIVQETQGIRRPRPLAKSYSYLHCHSCQVFTNKIKQDAQLSKKEKFWYITQPTKFSALCYYYSNKLLRFHSKMAVSKPTFLL